MSISMRDGTPIAVPRWKDEAVESSIFHATIRYVALGNIGEIVVALQNAALVRSHATSAQEAETPLAEAPEWALKDEAHRIERTFRFKNFREALSFVQKVGELAEAEGHHPDISFGWGYATVSLRTKKIKGLHENDFIMAAKIDRLAEAAAAGV